MVKIFGNVLTPRRLGIAQIYQSYRYDVIAAPWITGIGAIKIAKSVRIQGAGAK